ncbi:beta strand repeat-containing protein, partial [Haemophilus influenzae]|uniref:beta strand repeat-containing protein n=1 Tax=Haemophilus influenzae TaxID=727 RepID=UPI0035321C9D
GNINAQGSDIAETGGFVETSGHDLFINDSAIVDAKKWLLDPDTVSINNGENNDSHLISRGDNPNKFLKNDLMTVSNKTLYTALAKGIEVNISATQKITVAADVDVSNGTLTLHTERNGIEINSNITSTQNGNLTIKSGDWVDIHNNITLGTGFLNITAKSVAFEGKESGKSRVAASAQITAQGTITITGDKRDFRANNVSLNGTGNGLSIISTVNNLSHKLDGEINISGNVTINHTTRHNIEFWRTTANSYWNVTSLNVQGDSKFTFIKYVNSARNGNTGNRDLAGVIFNTRDLTMNFNVSKGSSVDFILKSAAAYNNRKETPFRFLSNISVAGGGSVNINELANLTNGGIEMKLGLINVSNGSNFTLTSNVRGKDAFKISKDLTINATDSNFTLKQSKDAFENGYGQKAIKTSNNLTLSGGNITLGGQNSSSDFKGNITIDKKTNVTIEAYNGRGLHDLKDRTSTFGNLTVNGNLSLVGSKTEVAGNLSISTGAVFKGNTSDSLNITGTFTNNGDSEININQGVVNLRDIINEGDLNITTNAKIGKKSIINGNITNNKGDLNITNNGRDTEIQIGGNISQKEGNLTISSDKVNITKQITIKAGVDEDSSSSSTKSNANLTIKTKTLELTNDLNISGFNKAEITAKNDSNLTIGKASSGDAKKVTFDKVKDSKISANGHKVTLNSEVETSNGNSDATGNSNGNNAGLTISAKDVAVNNNITSHKTVNISASEGGITTKADTTINAATGSVEVTAKTGDIKGEIESASGNVNITASGNTLNVSNITGQNVTVTANSGAVTTTKGSTINATTGNANITTQTGSINGKVESSSGSVTLIATGQTLAVGNISGSTVTVTANNAKLTTTEGSTINATTGAATISTKEGDLKGEIEAKQGSVKVTAKEGNLTVLNVTAKNDVTVKAEKGTLTTTSGGTIKSEESGVNLTAKSGNINGDINATSGAVTVTANTDTLSVANITSKTATLTANSGALTTLAGSTIKGTESVTTSSQSGSIGGEISGSTVKVTASGSLTTQSGSKIEAKAGEANVTSATGTIGGTVSGGTVNITANTGGLTIGSSAKVDATNGAATLTASSGKLTTEASSSITSAKGQVDLSARDGNIEGSINAANVTLNTTGTLTTVKGSSINANSGTLVINAEDAKLDGTASGDRTVVNATNASGSGSVTAKTSSSVNITGDLSTVNGLNIISKNGKNTVVLKGAEIDVKYIQPGVASANEVIEAKRVLEKVKDLSDEERETLAKLGVSAVRFVEPNNTITVNTQNEFTTRPSSQVTI